MNTLRANFNVLELSCSEQLKCAWTCSKAQCELTVKLLVLSINNGKEALLTLN